MSQEHIENWKIRKLIKKLSSIKGGGTSMISLMIKSGAQISLTAQMLTTELGASSNIKSRVNRLSVQSAITSTSYKLKTYTRTPANGLIIYCGTAISEVDGKERKICIDIVPAKPLRQSKYICGSEFDIEPLKELLITSDSYGFIIIDGHGQLLATVKGNAKTIHHRFTVDLPNKNRKGGQSALRFSRLRIEARNNYITKCNEMVKKYFTKDNVSTVKGLIVAGNARLKHKLVEASTFPGVLKSKVLNLLDITYGDKNGLTQAIEMSQSLLKDVKLVEEKQIISTFFEHIAKDTGKCCYGIEEIIYAMDMGAIETLILWEELPIMRYLFEDDTVLFVHPQNEKHKKLLEEVDSSIKSDELFSEWIVENYKEQGIDKCMLITDRSGQGLQFCNGFGGLGGILRWQVNFENNVSEKEHNDNLKNGKTANDIDLDEFDLGDEYAEYEDDFI